MAAGPIVLPSGPRGDLGQGGWAMASEFPQRCGHGVPCHLQDPRWELSLAVLTLTWLFLAVIIAGL